MKSIIICLNSNAPLLNISIKSKNIWIYVQETLFRTRCEYNRTKLLTIKEIKYFSLWNQNQYILLFVKLKIKLSVDDFVFEFEYSILPIKNKDEPKITSDVHQYISNHWLFKGCMYKLKQLATSQLVFMWLCDSFARFFFKFG